MKTGVCSITFRKLDVSSVLDLVSRSGLDGIEWGGDVHCPPTAGKEALMQIANSTRDIGLEVLSYGSYYNILKETDASWKESFCAVLEAARHLGTRTIRVWVGGGDSSVAKDDVFNLAAERLRWCGERAASMGIQIATEFHDGGLTDRVDSTLKLLGLTQHPNVGTYWQPAVDSKFRTSPDEFIRLKPHLTNLHVYQWKGKERMLLEDGAELWRPYLDLLKKWNFPGALILEFVKENSPEQFLQDARTLLGWVMGQGKIQK